MGTDAEGSRQCFIGVPSVAPFLRLGRSLALPTPASCFAHLPLGVFALNPDDVAPPPAAATGIFLSAIFLLPRGWLW